MRQNLGSGHCSIQCRAIGRPRLGGRTGLGRAGQGWDTGWDTGWGMGQGGEWGRLGDRGG